MHSVEQPRVRAIEFEWHVMESCLLIVFLFAHCCLHSGYGLVCHRALKACAEIMGIKDIYCKVEANTRNYQAIVRAFFDALVHQVTNLLSLAELLCLFRIFLHEEATLLRRTPQCASCY